MVRHRNKLITAVAVLAAATLTLSACGGGSSSSEPTASGSAAPTTPANSVPASLIGMQVEGVEGESWPSAPFGALRFWDNGTAWSQIELKKGVYKWDNLDHAVANAEAKGMTDILQVLGTTPTWAASKVSKGEYPPTPGAASAPKDLADWDAWVTAVVTKYKGRITAYEIWNEANLKMFYNGTPEKLAEMTKRAYDIIKSIDPEAKVVAASPALRLKSAVDRFFPTYLSELAAAGWPIDALSIHTYPDATGDPAARGLLVEGVKEIITAAGAPETIELWDTELNYGLGGLGLDKQDITGAKAAGFIVRTYIDDLRYGIARSYWYIWTQTPKEWLGIQAYPGAEAEQGFFALDNWVTGASYDGCTETGNAVTCNFSKAGAKWIVAWAETGTEQYTAPEGTQLVCDPLANCTETAAGTGITLTEVPIRVYLQQ
ncbi:MAG: GH39 family glycosyl hydrolase [Actinomycetes bacterium]